MFDCSTGGVAMQVALLSYPDGSQQPCVRPSLVGRGNGQVVVCQRTVHEDFHFIVSCLDEICDVDHIGSIDEDIHMASVHSHFTGGIHRTKVQADGAPRIVQPEGVLVAYST